MIEEHSNDAPELSAETLEEIAGAVRIGITFTSKSIFNETLSLQSIINILIQFDRNESIALCAEWNRWNTWVMFHHGTWKPAEKDQQQLLDTLVAPSAQRNALAVFDDEGFVSPFSEVSLITLIALLCRYAPTTGGHSAQTRSGHRTLFRALLSVQESIFPDNFLDLPVTEQFPFEVRVTLANISLQNRWAYDMGRLHALLTVPEIGSKLGGMTVREWFLKRLGVDGEDYECVANTLLGGTFYRANFRLLSQQQPDLYRCMEPLLRLSTAMPEDVVIGPDKTRPQADPHDLSDAGQYSNLLLIRPIIQLGEQLICTSTRNLFNKLHRGLPYLCLEARTDPDEEKTRPRDEFGNIFESYIIWLMKQWSVGERVKLVTNYWIQQSDRTAERDIAIISGEEAFVFEVKATVPAMRIRKFGSLQDLVSLHKKAAEQAYTAAEALRNGLAFEDRELRRPLPEMKRVVPCAITYEFLAIRWPYSDAFENALGQTIGKPLFSGQQGILPFQILDIQQVELWDDLFHLPAQLDRLFAALQNRALNPLKRYRDLPEDKRNRFRSDYADNPGSVRKLVEAAEASSGQRLKRLAGG